MCPIDALEIARQLEEQCYDRAEELAAEINGDLFYVPQEDIDALMSKLTPDNLEETASELAHLAYWFN
jgi:hypothetical protein